MANPASSVLVRSELVDGDKGIPNTNIIKTIIKGYAIKNESMLNQ